MDIVKQNNIPFCFDLISTQQINIIRNTPHIDQGFNQVEEFPEKFLERKREGAHGGHVREWFDRIYLGTMKSNSMG